MEPGYDVYNCSEPFEWNGARYIFGRVEPRAKMTASVAMMFRETAKDVWTRVMEFGYLELEDPFVQRIGGELVVGGTRITKVAGRYIDFRTVFYRDNGKGPFHLEYYTSGPENMKDIRLVELANGRIGVFTRPRGRETKKKYGVDCAIGYTEVASLRELTPKAVEEARPIKGLFREGEWGGCNQACLRPDGTILVAAHLSFRGAPAADGKPRAVYCNAAFTFDPATGKASRPKIVATRRLCPASEPKFPYLDDCVFASGFVFLPDGSVDLYTGLCDAAEARIRLQPAVLSD